MHNSANRTVTFTGDQRDRLRESVAERKPCFAGQLEHPHDVHLVYQPFFTRHQVVRVTSSEQRTIHVILGEQGEVEVLSGHVPVFNALAAMDPPGLILDEGTAQIYGIMCDAWTADEVTQERAVASFEDIPWSDGADPARREALRDELEDVVGPLHLAANDDGFLLRKWLVTAGRLVRREIFLGHDGRITRDDVVVAEDLPVAG